MHKLQINGYRMSELFGCLILLRLKLQSNRISTKNSLRLHGKSCSCILKQKPKQTEDTQVIFRFRFFFSSTGKVFGSGSCLFLSAGIDSYMY